MSEAVEDQKRAAAEAAAQEVQDGMLVGLGTGSTVAYLLPALAARRLKDIRCVATSIATERIGTELGLSIEPFDALDHLDLAIDGADQIAPDGWVVKGGGGAHTREKVVAAAADRFVVIADESKVVASITAPIPLELLSFGLPATLAALVPTTIRDGAPPSPDGGVIADYQGDLSDPAAVAAFLSSTPGVTDHGLFPPELTSAVIVARADGTLDRRIY
jgi:ribose 5-phosphate isomerase A